MVKPRRKATQKKKKTRKKTHTHTHTRKKSHIEKLHSTELQSAM